MRIFWFLFCVLIIIQSIGCGGRSKIDTENLSETEKQEIYTQAKRRILNELTCSNFYMEVEDYRAHRQRKELIQHRPYFPNYPAQFNILKNQTLYAVSVANVRSRLALRGLEGANPEFLDMHAPDIRDLPCQGKIDEWSKLKIEWINLQEVLPPELYKQESLWEKSLYFLESYMQAGQDFFYKSLVFLLFVALSIWAAYLHYILIAKRSFLGLWLIVITPISAIYWQIYFKYLSLGTTGFMSRWIPTSILLFVLFSCFALAASRLFKQEIGEEDKDPHNNVLDPYRVLIQAIDAGDMNNSVKLIADNTMLVHARDENGMTPLHYITSKGMGMQVSDVSVAKELLKHGALANARTLDENELTPLHIIAMHGDDLTIYHAQLADYLLDQGANVNEVTARGFSAIHIIASEGSQKAMDLLDILFKYKANPYLTTNDGETTWRHLWHQNDAMYRMISQYEMRYM